MTRSINPEKYPLIFHAHLQRVARGEFIDLKFPNKKLGTQARQTFYSLIRALDAQNHSIVQEISHMELLLIEQLQGSTSDPVWLRFRPRDESPMALAIKQSFENPELAQDEAQANILHDFPDPVGNNQISIEDSVKGIQEGLEQTLTQALPEYGSDLGLGLIPTEKKL